LITVQGYRVTVLEAVYHVVEHFAEHTGQIVLITKKLEPNNIYIQFGRARRS
jgi:uncharacterized damage-inducible protein DinB